MPFNFQRGQSKSKVPITKLMSILGAFAAGLIAIAIPGVYFTIAINEIQHTLTVEAAFLAKSIETAVQARPDLWEYESVRLKAFVSQSSVYEVEDEREIRNAGGKLVTKTDFIETQPIISVSAPFFDSGRLAGSIVVRHSIRIQVITTVLLGILSSLLGYLIYFIFRTYPIRKLESTLTELQQARDQMEQRVAVRTEELMRVNEELKTEIADHKQAEEALREAEKRYRTLFSRAGDGIFIMTVEGKLVDVNE